MSKRSEFMKACLDLGLNGAEILGYTKRMAGHTDEEKEALAEEFLKELAERHTMKPKKEYLEEMEKSGDMAKLKNTYHAYWKNEEELLQDALKAGAKGVADAIAPHIQFRKGSAECADIFPKEAQFEFAPLCVAYGQNRIVNLAPYFQENVWKRYLYVNGYTDRSLYAKLKRQSLGEVDAKLKQILFDLSVLGCRVKENETECVPLTEVWGENVEANADYLFPLLETLGWQVHFEGLKNPFGTSGYRYVESPIPESETQNNEQEDENRENH